MCKAKQFLSAIHGSIADTMPTPEQAYMMQLLLRMRRRERFIGLERNEAYRNLFLNMHADKANREAAGEMFDDMMKVWRPGMTLNVGLEFRKAPGAMLDPLVTSLEVLH